MYKEYRVHQANHSEGKGCNNQFGGTLGLNNHVGRQMSSRSIFKTYRNNLFKRDIRRDKTEKKERTLNGVFVA